MRQFVAVAVLLWLGVMAVRAQRAGSTAVLFEDARLIVGDDSAPIENGAMLVENGRFVKIGKKSEVQAPAGATRVSLSGKTVIPAFVNLHAHLGYERFTSHGDSQAAAENFTTENLLDHLQREAFYGTGTANDAGSAPVGFALQFQRDQAAQKFSPAAQIGIMAGVVPPNGGPDAVLIKGTRPLHASYEVVRAPEGRVAVQDIAAKNVRQLKIWLGDRNGAYPAMPHEVYDAVIDEAHKHGIKVHSHATSLRDQKDALRAGADLIVHVFTNVKIDDELIALIREKRPYWTPVMGFGERSPLCNNDPFSEQTMPAKVVEEVRANECRPNPNAAAREEILKYNFTKMIESGARLVLGTDTGVRARYAFGWAEHNEVERYVQLGLTPAQAIVAATSRPAEALGLANAGMLAEGRMADFVVLNANPLENIRNTREISNVYLRGTRLNRESMLSAWRQVETVQ